MSLDQNNEELVIDSFRPDPNSSNLQWFSAENFGGSTFLNNIYQADFLKTNLTKFAVISAKKGQRPQFFILRPRSSKITPAKEKERRKKKSEKKKSRRREKSNGYTPSFYSGYFGDSF